MKIRIRRMRPDDTIHTAQLLMNTINDLRGKHDLELIPVLPTLERNSLMCHLIKTDPKGSYVAFVNNRLAGFTQSLIRDGQWYLAFLFVHPKYQGTGVGKKLLKKSMLNKKDQEIHNSSLATFAFNPAAVALYTSFGMYPIQPLPMMVLDLKKNKNFSKIKNDYKFNVKAIEDYSQIPRLNRLDKKNRGIYRPEEHKFWIDDQKVFGYMFFEGRKFAGYSYFIRNFVIAPVNVTHKKYLIPVLTEMINMALVPDTEKIALWLSGTNSNVYDFLLKHKFRLEELELLMSDRMFYNPDLYIPATLAIF